MTTTAKLTRQAANNGRDQDHVSELSRLKLFSALHIFKRY